MLPSTMQGKDRERKGSTSETGDEFEEMVRSAFGRGIAFLSETEPDTVESQGQTLERIPKNATQLKPVIDKLMSKDLPEGINKSWLAEAKWQTKWVREQVSKDNRCLKRLLSGLEELGSEKFQEDFTNGGKDKI